MSLPAFPDQNRPDRAVITLGGEGVLAFLNTLLTCDVSTLAAGSAAYGALLNPQGKILHDMFVYQSEESVHLDCAREQQAALAAKLAMYRLRAKITIAIDNDIEAGVHMTKPADVTAYPDPRHAALGWRSLAAAGTFINAPGHHGYDQRRIMLGFGDSGRDIGVEKLFPHEANLDQFGGVSFSKGCYVGQEVVSRMQHRGTARNRLLPVTLTGESGAAITSGEKVIGELLSREGDHGLALVRLDRLADAAAPLVAGAGSVRVQKPDWITYDVTIAEAAR